MSHVTSHAAPTPTMSTQSNHDWNVGSGSLFCQQSNRKAAPMETANCNHCIGEA